MREGRAAVASITPQSLFSAFDESAMQEGAVYELRSDTPEDRAVVWQDFVQFRELLDAVTQGGDEGLPASRD